MAIALVAAIAMSGCSKVPDNVLPPEQMAALMADLHIGEAVIDFDYNSFYNDSTRKTLKQSIYAVHNVDQAAVDTSLAWYGNHIEEYIKVYDNTIELLKERQSNLASSKTQFAIEGDSVVVWTGPGRLLVNEHTPSRIISFNLYPDSTWHKGDIFMLRYTPVNTNAQIDSKVIIDYEEGIIAYTSDTPGLTNRMQKALQVDSTLTPVRLSGYITLPAGVSSYQIDSIALVRMRHYVAPNISLSHSRFNNGISASELRRRRAKTPPDTTNLLQLDNAPKEQAVERFRTEHPATTRPVHPAAGKTDRPQSSSQLEHTQHRQNASEHKATPQSRREAAARRQQAAPTKRTTLQRSNNN